MADSSKSKQFDMSILSDFAGYDSSRDKTNIASNVMVRGSQNVYKKLSGNISVRPGQKRRGLPDTTLSPVPSSFIWNTSWGATYVLTVSNNTLYVIIDNIWYVLQTGLTQTRYVFDKWWDNTEKKDRTLFVNGTDNMQWWSGGYTTVLSSTATSITKTGTTSWKLSGFTEQTLVIAGDDTTQFDITNPSGTTFRYTYDGTGTDPLITAASFPAGSYVYVNGQNFNASNNGVFTITDSGTNFFEVTNASGVAENDKTIGTGQLYNKFQQVVIINGITYGYLAGVNSTTITGVIPVASGITTNSTALQAVITVPNTPAADFLSGFIKVINNQVYVGSYTSRLCYISKNTDFTDYAVTNPRAPGDPELLTLDATLNGISVRLGNAYIAFGSNSWAEVSFTNTNDALGANIQLTKVDNKPVSGLQSAYAHEFIDSTGDNIIYLAKDKQVRMLGSANDSFTTVYPSFSQEIATELSEQNFTGGSLRCIGEFTYLTAPQEGKTWLYQVRNSINADGTVVAERLWHAPFLWNLTKVDEYNGTVVGFSNANPQWYDLWDTGQWFDDSPQEEPLPYECLLAFSYRNNGRRQGLMSFDKHFSEGYLTQGTPLNLEINYNYNGALATIQTIINSNTQPAYLFTPNNDSLPSLGDESLGDEPLGDVTDSSGTDSSTNLIKFKVINSLALRNCFEYQPIYYSNNVNAQWEILALGDNADVEPDENANFIINKRRNMI